ncbi:hypothetical protein MGN70_006392 [Eutypa lata]|nr:hypothetical protein MGN70_006392 [Eutypa lata]
MESNNTVGDSPPASAGQTREGIFRFMSLPSEIRLKVYEWLHLLCPIQLNPMFGLLRAPLREQDYLFVKPPYIPGLPDRECNETFYRLVDPTTTTTTTTPTTPTTLSANQQQQQQQQQQQLISPYRQMGTIPTALLLASKQIYHESRAIPFQHSEFIFATAPQPMPCLAHFFYGLSLAPWQRDAVRWARVELLWQPHLAVQAEWAPLCRLWAAGLRGLRLEVLAAELTHAMVREDEADRPGGGWSIQVVAEGLKALRELRYLDVMVVNFRCTDRAKVRWCEYLQDMLRREDRRDDEQVRVLCVQAVREIRAVVNAE